MNIETGYAYFVKSPRVIDDLRVLHPASHETSYMVAKKIVLSKTDYQNFSLDLLADRQFIEEFHSLCSHTPPLKCLLVTTAKSDEGILLVSRDKCFVDIAALYRRK